MPAETVTTEHKLRAALVELSELADELEERYPPEQETPFERLRRVHAELMGLSDHESSLARRPTLVLIRGGRADA